MLSFVFLFNSVTLHKQYFTYVWFDWYMKSNTNLNNESFKEINLKIQNK